MEVRDDYIYTGVSAFGVLSLPPDRSRWRGTHLTGIGGPIVGVPRRPMLFSWEGSDEEVVGTSAVALFSNRNQEYRKAPLTDGGEQTDWVWVRPDLTAEAVAVHDPRAALDHDHLYRMMHGPVPSPALVELRRLTSTLRATGDAEPLALDEAAITIVRALVDARYRVARVSRTHRTRPSTLRAHADAVNSAAGLIATSFDRPIGIEDVARVACMSPLHFCRVFKDRAGMTVHTYLCRIRIAEALERLADTGGGIAQIAVACGFSSSSHMSDTFLRVAGLRPSHARSAVRRGVHKRLRSIG